MNKTIINNNNISWKKKKTISCICNTQILVVKGSNKEDFKIPK